MTFLVGFACGVFALASVVGLFCWWAIADSIQDESIDH